VVGLGFDVNEALVDQSGFVDDGTALHHAVRKGHVACVERLLQLKANVNSQANNYLNSPLHLACSNNDPESVRLLLAHGADPSLRNDLDETPFDCAKENDASECLKLLQKHQLGK
jgi:ankyrin repeat protein